MSVEGKFLSKEINDLFWREGLTLVTAESCTAGSVAAAITAVAGSSQFFKGGIIAYSNEIKESLLGVNHETLETHGAVSEETVIEMVKGAMKSMNSDCAVATSGIAGPTGGTPDKPVGTIWIAAGCKDKVITLKLEGDEGRNKNIANATQNALQLLLTSIRISAAVCRRWRRQICRRCFLFLSVKKLNSAGRQPGCHRVLAKFPVVDVRYRRWTTCLSNHVSIPTDYSASR